MDVYIFKCLLSTNGLKIMKCEICNKGIATTAYTHIVDDEKRTLLLCTECLPSEMNVTVESTVESATADSTVKSQSSDDLEVPELKKKAKVDFSSDSAASAVNEKICPSCGMDYKQFKKVGRLGCSTCYSEFESDLGPLLKKIHGADEHTGKNWILIKGSSKPSSKIPLADLSVKLQKAVEKEDFESAAEIRDMIRSRSGKTDDGEEK